jgi:hypothetical protein
VIVLSIVRQTLLKKLKNQCILRRLMSRRLLNISGAIPMLAILTMTAAILTTTMAVSGNPFPSAYACQTNAKGCIEQGGPGSSFLAPPEVSGCHVFPPVGECAFDSTPPFMGQGPGFDPHAEDGIGT